MLGLPPRPVLLRAPECHARHKACLYPRPGQERRRRNGEHDVKRQHNSPRDLRSDSTATAVALRTGRAGYSGGRRGGRAGVAVLTAFSRDGHPRCRPAAHGPHVRCCAKARTGGGWRPCPPVAIGVLLRRWRSVPRSHHPRGLGPGWQLLAGRWRPVHGVRPEQSLLAARRLGRPDGLRGPLLRDTSRLKIRSAAGALADGSAPRLARRRAPDVRERLGGPAVRRLPAARSSFAHSL